MTPYVNLTFTWSAVALSTPIVTVVSMPGQIQEGGQCEAPQED